MCLATFIERKFVPHHVRLKSETGRAHYQAILKHILRPETAGRIFAGNNKAKAENSPRLALP
jgi:hypothetical protein